MPALPSIASELQSNEGFSPEVISEEYSQLSQNNQITTIVNLKINDSPIKKFITVIQNSFNHVLVNLDDLASYKVKTEYLNDALITLNNKQYINLDLLEGTSYSLDKQFLLLKVHFPNQEIASGTQYNHYVGLIHLADIKEEPENAAEFIVSLKINYEDTDTLSTIIKDAANHILVPLDDLIKFSIKDNYLAAASIDRNGKKYININNLPDIKSKFDEENLALEINFPIKAMITQEMNAVADDINASNIISKPSTGIYLNYDILIAWSGKTRYANGIQQLSYFSDKGVLLSDFFVKRRLSKSETNQFTRLDTYWTLDRIKSLSRWKIGDSLTQASDWSGSTRFGGIQYATNFNIKPNLIKTPLIDFVGSSTLPSTLDVYSNAVQVYSNKDINTGSFDLNNIPVSTGRGDLIVKTTDITGKVQTLVLPYYASALLLETGLSDYSFSLGSQRQEYGIQSNRYKGFVASADYLRGFNDYWTAGGHIDSFNNKTSVGVTNNIQIGNYGTISSSIATNLFAGKNGQIFSLGYEYQGKKFSFNTKVTTYKRHFKDVYSSSTGSSKPSVNANIGYGDKDIGTFSLNFLSFASTLGEGISARIKTFSLNYEKQLTKNCSIRFSAGKTIQKLLRNYFASVSFSVSLDNFLADVSSEKQTGNHRVTTFDFANPISKPLGWGYRGSIIDDTINKNYEVTIDRHGSKFNNSLYLSKYAQTTTQQLETSGGVVYMGKSVYFTRPLQDSLILVKAGNFKDIPVYLNNIPVGDTDKHGQLLIPNVASYITSEIKLDEIKLPLDSEFSYLTLNVRPSWRSGSLLDFNVKSVKSLKVVLVDTKNNPIVLNSSVTIDELPDPILLGYNGVLYIDDIRDLLSITGKACQAANECCSFTAKIDTTSHDVPLDLGTIICQ